jgi:hypothetical protein
MRRRKAQTIDVPCTVKGCKVVAKNTPYASPAAPMLTALETLEKQGWSYQIGFFSMLTGDHAQRCPAHNGKASP